MLFRKSEIIISLIFVLALSLFTPAQQSKTDTNASPVQRLEVLHQKIESMRRSLSGALSSLKEDAKDDRGKKDKKDDKSATETPAGRLRGLDKEADKMQSDINNLRGKLDRSEKYQMSDIEQLETTVSEFQTRVDNALI